MNSFFLVVVVLVMVVVVVVVCVCVCVCTFFHTCYTAPKVSYILCKDNKMYLTSPVPQSVSLSLSDWLVDSFADEREKEKLN